MSVILENQVLWDKCLKKLEDEIDQHDFNMWVRPLNAINNANTFILYAPNRFVKDWLSDNLLQQLESAVNHFSSENKPISIELNNSHAVINDEPSGVVSIDSPNQELSSVSDDAKQFSTNALNSVFTFEHHIEGKSNQIARAATRQVSENPGSAYNPLFIYGGVGLGKTPSDACRRQFNQ